jgi:hypothetical protein
MASARFTSDEFHLPGANFTNWKLSSAARFKKGGFSQLCRLNVPLARILGSVG